MNLVMINLPRIITLIYLDTLFSQEMPYPVATGHPKF